MDVRTLGRGLWTSPPVEEVFRGQARTQLPTCPPHAVIVETGSTPVNQIELPERPYDDRSPSDRWGAPARPRPRPQLPAGGHGPPHPRPGGRCCGQASVAAPRRRPRAGRARRPCPALLPRGRRDRFATRAHADATSRGGRRSASGAPRRVPAVCRVAGLVDRWASLMASATWPRCRPTRGPRAALRGYQRAKVREDSGVFLRGSVANALRHTADGRANLQVFCRGKSGNKCRGSVGL